MENTKKISITNNKKKRKKSGSLASHQGSVEYPDELIFVVKDAYGEIVDAGIDEFFKLERQAPTYLVLTLTGRDENSPYKIIVEADSKITIRPFGELVPAP